MILNCSVVFIHSKIIYMIFKKIKAKEDDVFRNKLEIADQSKTIFKKNPGIILYPVLGALINIITFVLFIMISKGSGAVVFALIIWYLLFNIFTAFFNAATAANTKASLSGGSPSFSFGIKTAFKKMNLIINWAVFEGTIGHIMGFLSDMKMSKAFNFSGDIAWGFVKYFIIPISIFENKNVKDAINESQRLINKSWGKSAGGDFRVSIVSYIPLMLVLLILMFSSVLKDEFVTYGLFVVTIFTLLLGSLINFTLRTIFSTILYLNAKGKTK
jgi:hypothetical protein